MKSTVAGLLAAMVCAAHLAQAADELKPSHVGVGLSLKAGSLGAGGDLTVGVTENFNLRAGVGFFTWTHQFNEEANDHKQLKLDLLNIPLTVDWHPITGNGFRISAGVMFNNDRGELSAQSGQSISINEHDYVVTAFSGKVDFGRIGPYLGIGYGNAADTSSHWHCALDLGVVYVGTPNITLSATAADPAQQAALNSDLSTQTTTWLKDIEPFKFYPVLSLGFSYTF
jgi:hypothetical protein